MSTVKNDLIQINRDTSYLLGMAERQGEVAGELLSEIRRLRDDTTDAIGRMAFMTQEAIQGAVDELKSELHRIQTELAQVIGVSAELLFQGQMMQAQAITGTGKVISKAVGNAGSDIGGGAFFGGLLAMLGIGAAGRMVADAIEDAAATRSPSEAEVKEKALVLLVGELLDRRPYVTYKYVVDVASDKRKGILSRREAQLYLRVLVDEGVLYEYRRGEGMALEMNRQHQRVRKVMAAQAAQSQRKGSRKES